ncbi:MAG: hypothetical protein ACREA0_00360 [bacterium]
MIAPSSRMLWTPILRRLSDVPGFVVWKHLGSAFAGSGDVDAMVDNGHDLAAVTELLREEAFERGFSHLVTCEHMPGSRVHLLVGRSWWPRLKELDVKTAPSKGGCAWAPPGAVRSLAVKNESGIRAVPPSVEAVIDLVYWAVRPLRKPSGRFKQEVIRAYLAEDPTLARSAIEQLVPPAARSAVHELATRIADGDWSGRPSRRAWAGFARTALLDPVFLSERLRFRARFLARRTCVALDAARRGRTALQLTPEQFVEAAGDEHTVVGNLEQ